MKSFVFSLLFIMCSSLVANAQINFEPITIKERGLFNKKYYERCDVEMDEAHLLKLLMKDPQMEAYTKPMGVNLLVSTILRVTGSVLIFVPLTQELSDHDDPNWTLGAIGAGAVIASIPFKKWFDKNAREAVQYYNNSYKASLNLEFNGNGLGLVMKF